MLFENVKDIDDEFESFGIMYILQTMLTDCVVYVIQKQKF